MKSERLTPCDWLFVAFLAVCLTGLVLGAMGTAPGAAFTCGMIGSMGMGLCYVALLCVNGNEARKSAALHGEVSYVRSILDPIRNERDNLRDELERASR